MFACETLRELFEPAFQYAHRALLDDAALHRERHGMGTTLTALAIKDGKATIAHVGDSRCYLIRGGSLRVEGRQITRDHSYRGTLDNCLGYKPEAHRGTDVEEVAVEPGDLFVLCTDGVSRYMDADKVAHLVSTAKFASHFIHRPVEAGDIARALVKHAVRAGGEDNATAVVVEVLE